MNPKVCLVTGANRGIGLEFVKQLLRLPEPPRLIFAGCRNPDQAQELKKISESHAAVKPVKIDLNNLSCLEETKKQIETLCGDDGINLLINNAGIFKVEKFEDTSAESLRLFFQVNSIGPFIVTQAFLPLIKKAAKAQSGDELSVSRAAIINITSDSGSIGFGVKESFATDGDMYGYRMSKAAANMFIANLAHTAKADKVLAACVHPGWVATDMGLAAAGDGAREGDTADLGIVTTETSVSGMLNVMAKFGEKDVGRYTDNEGHDWPW